MDSDSMDSMDSMDNEKNGNGKKQLQLLVWLCCQFFFAAVMDRREMISGPRER
jgi:hypothetical protein